MIEKKEKIYFYIIVVVCLITIALSCYAFLILPKSNVALGSFF